MPVVKKKGTKSSRRNDVYTQETARSAHASRVEGDRPRQQTVNPSTQNHVQGQSRSHEIARVSRGHHSSLFLHSNSEHQYRRYAPYNVAVRNNGCENHSAVACNFRLEVQRCAQQIVDSILGSGCLGMRARQASPGVAGGLMHTPQIPIRHPLSGPFWTNPAQMPPPHPTSGPSLVTVPQLPVLRGSGPLNTYVPQMPPTALFGGVHQNVHFGHSHYHMHQNAHFGHGHCHVHMNAHIGHSNCHLHMNRH